MEHLDWLGPGLCHQLDWRSMEGAWLCDRCTGLYIGGLLGVAHGAPFSRRLGLLAQLLVASLFFLPLVADKLYFGFESEIDVTAWRIATGLFAGAGTGLFLAARARPHLRAPRLPAWLTERWWRWAWLALAAASLSAALGSLLLLNALVLLGLVALCLAGTTWALALIARGLRALRRSAEAAPPPAFGLPLLSLIVLAELILVALTPSEYKPHIGWLWWALSLFGLGPWV
jgi:uncharacterized membrane protein